MRAQRVAAEIQAEISDILRTRLHDPRIGFVSLTRVEVTDDLSIAKVFVSILGELQVKQLSMRGLEAATPYIRREVGKRMELRFVPEIRFIEDASLERGSLVIAKLREMEKAEAVKPVPKTKIKKKAKKK